MEALDNGYLWCKNNNGSDPSSSGVGNSGQWGPNPGGPSGGPNPGGPSGGPDPQNTALAGQHIINNNSSGSSEGDKPLSDLDRFNMSEEYYKSLLDQKAVEKLEDLRIASCKALDEADRLILIEKQKAPSDQNWDKLFRDIQAIHDGVDRVTAKVNEEISLEEVKFYDLQTKKLDPEVKSRAKADNNLGTKHNYWQKVWSSASDEQAKGYAKPKLDQAKEQSEKTRFEKLEWKKKYNESVEKYNEILDKSRRR